MSDGREHIGHKENCDAPEIVVQRARVACLTCGRFAPRTDIPAGRCRDCGGACRPDMPVCGRCNKTAALRASQAKESQPVTTEAITTPPPYDARPVCRGCYQPATVRVKPGRGFVCPCSTGKAA